MNAHDNIPATTGTVTPGPQRRAGNGFRNAVWGFGAILLVRLMKRADGAALPDVLGTVAGLLSMAVAEIHFAVVEQHLVLYWLYGWFFIIVGLAQLAWAIVVLTSPAKLILW